jgi:ABC-type branched-subunit amino acid transport system permease subunit
VALPLLLTESSQQQTYAEILAFALCATSVTVLTGWAGQLSLGQMGFAGIGALSAAAFVRGASVDIGWGSVHLLKGSLPAIPFGFALLAGAAVACLLASLVGVGALRVRGLLLAVSTLAFAIAAQDYIFPLNFFSLGQETVQLPRGNIGPFNVNLNNRGYYYGTLIVLAVVLVLLGRLRRSGIGRTIVGVRENENAAAALTVSPIKAKLTAYSVSGFIAGLGGAILGGLAVTIGYTESFFTVDDSLALVAMAVIGGLGGQGRCRHRRAVGHRSPRLLAQQQPRPPAHLEHRSADHPPVHPRWVHPDRVLVPRRSAALHREAPAGGAGENVGRTPDVADPQPSPPAPCGPTTTVRFCARWASRWPSAASWP